VIFINVQQGSFKKRIQSLEIKYEGSKTNFFTKTLEYFYKGFMLGQ